MWAKPETTNEQTAIVRVLDTVDEAIQQTAALIEKLKKIKAGLLHDLLTRGINENGQLRDFVRHPDQFKDSPLGKVPKAWKVEPLSALIDSLESGVSVNSQDREKGPSELGVLKTSCVNGGVFDCKEHKAVVSRDVQRTSCRVRANSIIVSRMNTPILVGENAFVDRDYPGLFLPDRLWQTVMNPDRATCVRWLSHVLQYEPTRRCISDTATGTSGSMKNIAQRKFLAIMIRVPEPGEQQEIAIRVDAMANRLQAETATLRKLTMMKRGLMQDLLQGRVRVPVDIAAEHERKSVAAAKGKKGHEANIYFKRSVLAAEIVSLMHKSPTFGHVKFMKTLYLVEQLADVALKGHYHRAAAGPLDNHMIRSVDGQMEKQKWFHKVPRKQGADGKPAGYTYEAMEKAGGHREWFAKYWEGARAKIQSVVDLLQPLDTQRCEIIATLYSAWSDMLTAGRTVTDDAIITEVLTNWHASKQAIPRDRWSKALGWMREKALVPVCSACKETK